MMLRPDWWDDAACVGRPTDLFFPERGDRASVRQAKAICAACPVTHLCRSWVDLWEEGQPLGIFGGESAQQRRKRRSGQGRRLKTHCHAGHEFTPENTYITTSGARSCRTCHRIYRREVKAWAPD